MQCNLGFSVLGISDVCVYIYFREKRKNSSSFFGVCFIDAISIYPKCLFVFVTIFGNFEQVNRIYKMPG